MGRTAAGRIGWGLSFHPLASLAGVFSLLSAPDGGAWGAIQQPRAVHYGSYTYFGFIHSGGAVKIAAVNETTRVTGSPIALRTFSVDDHNNPALWVRSSDHRLVVAYCSHDGAAMYVRISTNTLDSDPTISGGFGTEADVATQLGGFSDRTYPIFLELSAETSSPLYLFWREVGSSTSRLAMSKSTDGGVTWSTRVLLYGATSTLCYWNIITNGSDRFDVFLADYGSTTGELYHFYYSGGHYFTSDGTDTGAAPLTDGTGGLTRTDLTLVLDHTNGVVDRCLGVSWDGTAPAALAWQKNGTTTRRVVSVRWRSGAWQADTVVDDVGGFMSGNAYQSSCAMQFDDPDVVLVAKKVGSRFEMFRYTSSDDGATWTAEQLTSGSSVDNFNPAAIWDGSAALQCIWPYGTFVSDTSFSLGMMASTS